MAWIKLLSSGTSAQIDSPVPTHFSALNENLENYADYAAF